MGAPTLTGEWPVAPDASVIAAGRMMADEGVRHLVIDGADGGVLSIRDVIEALVA